MTSLVTGGAGYIGSHMAHLLHTKGEDVVIVDSLEGGLESRLVPNAPFLKISILDLDNLEKAFKKYKFDSVFHFAAKKSVSESVAKPDLYRTYNVLGTANILRLVEKYEVKKIINASTAAVYGELQEGIASEESKTNPLSPYGKTKLDAEVLVTEFSKRTKIPAVSMRLFNVAGTASKVLSDNSKDNLIPIAFDKLRTKSVFSIFGTDFETSDGTAVRDYIDVRDVVMSALQIYLSDRLDNYSYNIGTSRGSSVLQVVNEVGKSLGVQPEIQFLNRREGDPGELIASIELAKRDFAFSPKYSLQEIIESLAELSDTTA